MNYLPEEGGKRMLVAALYILLGGVFAFVMLKYVLDLFLPFVIAWLVALAVHPVIVFINKKTKIPLRLLSIVFVLLVLTLLGALIFLICDRLLYEIRSFAEMLEQNSEMWINKILGKVHILLDRLPFLRDFGNDEELLAMAGDIAKKMLTDLTADIPNMLGKIIVKLPNILFVSLILIMAAYYFCADFSTVNSYMLSFLPQKARGRLRDVKAVMMKTGVKLLKGYLLTMALTFLQLLIGFSMLGINYAFTLALITALIDVLPVVGVGTVLVPWAIVKLVIGSTYQGFGLLIIFAVVSVVREILEPKIIGQSIGLHPLATLVSMYVGLRICGLIGILAGPVIVMAVNSILPNRQSPEAG